MNMNEELKQHILSNNLLIKTEAGSKLYGLSTETSDTDILGVFFEPLEHLIGFGKCETLDVSIKDKDENGKNTVNAIDEKYYSLRKFIYMMQNGNPTIIEILFATNAEYRHPFMDILYENRFNLINRHSVMSSFIGYARGQAHSLEVKSPNITLIKKVYNGLKDIEYAESDSLFNVLKDKVRPMFEDFNKLQGKLRDMYDIGNKTTDEKKAITKKMNKLNIGTREFPINMPFKKFMAQLQDAIDKASNRAELIEAHGYDTKFASHYLRLLYQGLELLETGDIKFPLQNTQQLMLVKQGKVPLEEVFKIGESLIDKINNMKSSVLKKKTNPHVIEKLVVDFYKQVYNIGGDCISSVLKKEKFE